MPVTRNVVTDFEYDFVLPAKDFVSVITKKLKVKLEYETRITNDYMRGSKVGEFKFESCEFCVTIPSYIYNFVKDKHRKFSNYKIGKLGEYAGGSTIWDKEHKFPRVMKSSSFNGLLGQLTDMAMWCKHIKELETLECENKVIFVTSSYFNEDSKCNFNFAAMGNKIKLDFHFFVAYKKYIKRPHGGMFHLEYWQSPSDRGDDSEAIEYYGLFKKMPRYKEMHVGRGAKELPLLKGSTIKNYTEIPHTDEREEFFRQIEINIAKVSMAVDGFVKDINENNVDKKLLRSKQIFELTTNKVNNDE